jgi:hypothetical protein
MARSETELNLPWRRLRTFGLLQAVGIIFPLCDKTEDSNKTHWIQNGISFVSFAILAKYARSGIADLSNRRSITLSVRVSLFYLAIFNVFTLNQVGVLGRLLLDGIAFLLCTWSFLRGEIIDRKTQFIRVILVKDNPVNLRVFMGRLPKFSLHERTSESIAPSDYFEAQKLTLAIKEVAANVSYIAPCEVATLLEATNCLENASEANFLLSRLKRQFLLLISL